MELLGTDKLSNKIKKVLYHLHLCNVELGLLKITLAK